MTAAAAGKRRLPANCDVHRRETSPSGAVRPTLSRSSTILGSRACHLTRALNPEREGRHDRA
jgi:hypothetical protein